MQLRALTIGIAFSVLPLPVWAKIKVDNAHLRVATFLPHLQGKEDGRLQAKSLCWRSICFRRFGKHFQLCLLSITHFRPF